MGKMNRAMDDFEVNLCVEGACELCDFRLCEMERSSPEQTKNTVRICVLRDFEKPERVTIIGGSASRKVTLRNAVALLRATAMSMEHVMLDRMPGDEIAKRFHDALYGVIKTAYKKPKDAAVILDCLDRMLETREDEADDK